MPEQPAQPTQPKNDQDGPFNGVREYPGLTARKVAALINREYD